MAVYSIRPGNDNGKQAYITGNRGRYDGFVENNGVRYARNAISNFFSYASYRMPKVKYPNLKNIARLSDDQFEKKMAQLDAAVAASAHVLETMPPLDYTLKYLPGKTDYNKLDTVALIGAAYEELGKRLSVKTEALTKKLVKAFNSVNISADALDLNKDGKVDAGEYASSILAADILSKDKGFDIKAIDGKINLSGHLKLLGFFNRKNEYFASRVFNYLHGFYNLDYAKDKFVQEPGNRAR